MQFKAIVVHLADPVSGEVRRVQKFNDIIQRAEIVRTKLGLNKSQFSTRIGMKPQSYNNFIGSPGSKPNMELFNGVVREFGVDPMWLLNGAGAPFVSSGTEFQTAQVGTSQARKDLPPRFKHNPQAIRQLRQELDILLSAYRGRATPLLTSDVRPDPQAHHAIQVLTHLFWASPIDTAAQVVSMLDHLSRVAEEIEWLNSDNESADVGT